MRSRLLGLSLCRFRVVDVRASLVAGARSERREVPKRVAWRCGAEMDAEKPAGAVDAARFSGGWLGEELV